MVQLDDVLTERHAIGERKLKFRNEYQAQIHPLYSGEVHIGVIYVVGLTAIACSASPMHGASWDWLLVVPVLAFCNLVAWWIVRYVMHLLFAVGTLRAVSA